MKTPANRSWSHAFTQETQSQETAISTDAPKTAKFPSSVDTSTVPNPTSKNHPMTDDEKVDQAAIESMDASDPPAFQPSTTGASPDRKTDKTKAKP